MATRRARHPRSCLPGRARRRRNWAPRASSAAAPEEGAAGSKLERLPRAAGPARAGCAVSRCAGRLARAPRGPSTSSLSASLTLTAPSEHPGCGARPAPGPRPPRPTPGAPRPAPLLREGPPLALSHGSRNEGVEPARGLAAGRAPGEVNPSISASSAGLT